MIDQEVPKPAEEHRDCWGPLGHPEEKGVLWTWSQKLLGLNLQNADQSKSANNAVILQGFNQTPAAGGAALGQWYPGLVLQELKVVGGMNTTRDPHAHCVKHRQLML